MFFLSNSHFNAYKLHSICLLNFNFFSQPGWQVGPSFWTLALQDFDNAIRECIEMFLCCSFSDPEWSLANLSTKMGGLGLRSTEHHSSAAFLSSQAACRDLCIKLDPNYVSIPDDRQTDSYRALSDYNTKVSPEDMLQGNLDSCPRQQSLSQNIDKFTMAIIKEN